jgi:hypothetical protein
MNLRMKHTPLRNYVNLAPVQSASGAGHMSVGMTRSSRGPQWKDRSAIWPRAAVIFLLVALAGLSTFAKYTPYLPKTDPSHFVNNATKLKVAQTPVVLDRTPLHPFTVIVPPRPAYRPRRTDKPVAPPIQLIGLTVSLQHRSPPTSLS